MKKKVVVRISGGLGNQLFRYAAAWSLAQRTGRALRFDLTDFIVFAGGRKNQMAHFSGPAVTPPWGWLPSALYLAAYILYKRVNAKWFPMLLRGLRVLRLEESSPWVCVPAFFDEATAFADKTLYVDGNCQNLAYLTDAEGIRNELRFADPPLARNRTLLEQVAQGPSVSVHVRRSDYLLIAGSPVLPPAYYAKAAERIRAFEPAPQWVIFSDDILWCRENLAFLEGALYVEGNEAEPWEDLRLMAACRHHIIANSSFSWWGAYLGRDTGGVTVAPEKWFEEVPTSSCLLKEGWLTAPSF